MPEDNDWEVCQLRWGSYPPEAVVCHSVDGSEIRRSPDIGVDPIVHDVCFIDNRWISRRISEPSLVGGFNPSEKYSSK